MSANNYRNGCCTPAGCLRPNEANGQPGDAREEADAVRVLCNNADCPLMPGLMHRQCFDVWEASVLHYLRSCGRARSWSERQRHQNLWTKKGYDLAYKACGCLCGRGHLRKDLDWPAASVRNKSSANGIIAEEEASGRPNNQRLKQQQQQSKNSPAKNNPPMKQSMTSAMSSSTTTAAAILLLNQQIRHRANSLSSTGSTASSASGSSSPPEVALPVVPPSAGKTSPPSSSSASVFPAHSRRTSAIALKALPSNNDRERRGSGNSGLFAHRSDFSAFNVLPRTKLNSYHIKMEDEGSYGNDDIRCFILSNLATARMSKTFCLVCQSAIQIYDRYPLIDGTFFLSPKQYTKACIPVTVDGRQQHLSAVCMSCLEGWNCSLRCRSCRTPWNGSSLILGTMYSYDVFAAVPCCPDRLRCNQCSGLVVQPDHRYQYFSQYSRDLSCPHCASHQHHFVKPLPSIFELFRH